MFSRFLAISGLSPLTFTIIAPSNRPSARDLCLMLVKPVVSNTLYKLLLTETWEEVPGSGGEEHQSVDTPGVYVLATDLALVWDPELKAQVYLCAQDNDVPVRVRLGLDGSHER